MFSLLVYVQSTQKFIFTRNFKLATSYQYSLLICYYLALYDFFELKLIRAKTGFLLSELSLLVIRVPENFGRVFSTIFSGVHILKPSTAYSSTVRWKIREATDCLLHGLLRWNSVVYVFFLLAKHRNKSIFSRLKSFGVL